MRLHPDEDRHRAAPIALVARSKARDGSGHVVRDVEPQRDLGRHGVVVGSLEQLGRSQDQQSRSAVPKLEGGDPAEQPSERTGEHRPDAQSDRYALALTRLLDVADGVDDGERRHQARDHRQGGDGAGAEETHEADGDRGPRIAPRLSIARSKA
jgi:hypothetical protein